MKTTDVEALFGLRPIEPKRPKVLIRLNLDADIVQWLKAQPESASYIVRGVMRQYMQASIAAGSVRGPEGVIKNE